MEHGKTKFEYSYDFEVSFSQPNLYYKNTKISGKDGILITNDINKIDGTQPLTKNKFKDFLTPLIEKFIKEREPKVSVWKPTSEYLLADADLNILKNNIKANKPLYNIFRLSGYVTQEVIAKEINKISNSRNRSHLQSKLNDSLNRYINKIWGNNIDLIIELTENGKFSLLIKDKGIENQHDRFAITERSQGAQHFLSLILSLSLETKNQERENELILIDEPEVHLHPSGIRDIAKELLKIGEKNHVFLATHSPFMIDRKGKSRHFIVKKDKKATTNLKRIKESDNIIDDEVLQEAFGIDVYRDLLNPHSILVEGLSDKLFIQKALKCIGQENIGITNGHGTNLITLASKVNFDDLSIVVLLDDDEAGRNDKEKILKIGGVFNENNVFTIRDLVGDIIQNGTIEDTVNSDYIKVQFNKCYNEKFGELPDIEFSGSTPIICKIIEYLKSKRKYKDWDMDSFKKKLSDDFNPSKDALSRNNPLLKKLAENLHKVILHNKSVK